VTLTVATTASGIAKRGKTGWTRLARQLLRSALGVSAFALASSVLATPRRTAKAVSSADPAAARPKVAVVVVGLDGVRWREVYEGVDPRLAPGRHRTGAELMPRLHELIARGCAVGAPGAGAPINASGPELVSLPGYSEMLTGRRVTGCMDNACSSTTSPSVADQLVRSDPRAKVAIISSWPDIATVAANDAKVLVSAGRHAGRTRAALANAPATSDSLRRAENAPPWPGHGDFRPDRFTAELARAYLEAEEPQFLFVGLGEPDEFAHHGDYAGYLKSLEHADQHIGQFATALAAMAKRGTRTALFVTTDHGRAANFRDHGRAFPESARVWLVASGSAIPVRGLVHAPQERRLADLAPTIRPLLGLPRDFGSSAGEPLSELLGP